MKREWRRYLCRGIDLIGRTVRGIWYRSVYLSWITFGRQVSFAGRITCPGVSGTISIGDRVQLGPDISLAVADGGSLSIGSDCSINRGTIVSSRQSVRIGDGTRIGDACSIKDSDHRLVDGVPIRVSGFAASPVIFRNVWVGRLVTILPGVTIGDDAVIGAHSRVNSDIPARCVAFGVPARVQRKLS